MNALSPARSHRHLIALIAAGVAFLVLAAFGIYGLITGPGGDRPETPPGTATPGPVPTPPDGPTRPAPRVPPVPASSDPETFARNVAKALFTWDTGAGFMPVDYTMVILDVGDPSGTEQAGLASDVAGYLPSPDAWLDLREYATTQSLTITDIVVPDDWADAVAQAQPGQLAPGTVAYTIDGTRHRAGVWNDDPVDADSDVAFTVFITCPSEPGESCYLLRLSQLDNPLR